MDKAKVQPERRRSYDGSLLERPQKLGFLPTWSFWNRADVWRSGQWFVVPVAGLSACAGVFVGALLPGWSLPLAGLLFGALPVTIVMGTLERYIRRKLTTRS